MLSLPPSQRPHCQVCGRVTSVLVHHAHVLRFRNGNQTIEWDECFGCNAKADDRAARLKREAEEDRKVKLPETPPRAKRTTGLPFIDQIAGVDE